MIDLNGETELDHSMHPVTVTRTDFGREPGFLLRVDCKQDGSRKIQVSTLYMGPDRQIPEPRRSNVFYLAMQRTPVTFPASGC
jgi:hypothetical protein